MQRGIPNAVFIVPSSLVSAKQTKRQAGKTGGPGRGMCADELVTILKTYLAWRDLNKLGQNFTLVMDNDPTHTSRHFLFMSSQLNVTVLFLPPRSHDLSPPDSHLFGVAKPLWLKQLEINPDANWMKCVRRLIWLMEGLPSGPHIDNYVEKLKACLQAEGKRFDVEYAIMKRARK